MSCHCQKDAQGPARQRVSRPQPSPANIKPKASVESMPGQRMKLWHNTAPTKAPSLMHAGALCISLLNYTLNTNVVTYCRYIFYTQATSSLIGFNCKHEVSGQCCRSARPPSTTLNQPNQNFMFRPTSIPVYGSMCV